MKLLDPRLKDVCKASGASLSQVFYVWQALSTKTDMDAFAAFTKCPQDLIDKISAGIKAAGLSTKAKAACRLPGDFFTDEVFAWPCDELGWSMDDAKDQSSRFNDFWAGKPGKDGVKSDWFATWRNWCRNARVVPSKAPVGQSPLSGDYLADLDRMIALYRKMNREDWVRDAEGKAKEYRRRHGLPIGEVVGSLFPMVTNSENELMTQH